MCKDVALAIKIDVVKQVLHVGPSGAVGALVASSMQEVEDTAVPWRPSTASQMVDAGEGFARLRISSEREGHGIRAEQVAHELITHDVPALRRTLGWA